MLKYMYISTPVRERGRSMAERKWTDEQLSAIETRDKTLLVSAAAGSGKTATLTERIIRSLTDEKNPLSVDSLLAVTYTTAAAAELRAKLSRALEEAVKRDPENKTLVRQLYLLPSAKICTIDSFLGEILRQNADRVGVSPSYRIADEAECAILSGNLLSSMISAAYNGEMPEVASPEEFEELCEALTGTKSTGELSDVFRMISARCECDEEGVGILLPLIEKFNPAKFTAPENSFHGGYLLSRSGEYAEHYLAQLGKFAPTLSSGNKTEQRYYEVLLSDRARLAAISSAKTYSEMRDAMHIPYVSLPTGKLEKTETTVEYAELRSRMKSEGERLSVCFEYTAEEWRPLYEGLYKSLLVMYRFVSRYERLLLLEKISRAALSFSDVARLAYECLVKDGEPTDIALSLRRRFKAIYIDEYQDVNRLQNRIFEVISNPDNRFMVGDIKQSIYSFRLARPEIFAEMKASFPPLSEAESSEVASVFMSANFRCDEPIINLTNSIFDKIFPKIDSLGYKSGDSLRYAKPVGEGECRGSHTPEILVVEGRASRSKANPNPQPPPSQPRVVAEKIRELLASGTKNDGTPIMPSDIAILMRSKTKSRDYAEALGEVGIESEISGDGEFFLSPEILLALSALNSIDNPRRDIYLAAFMCSPLFGFSPDELYVIRSAGGETLYDSLINHTSSHPEDSHAAHFLSRLQYYRAISEDVGVDTLIYKLYHETGLYPLAAKNGGGDNLMLLYDYARSYESGAFKGLYNFISFINNLIDTGTEHSVIDGEREGSSESAVKILSCHKSKGLEYPVVFLVEAGAAFSGQDKLPRLLFAEGFGISTRLRTPSGLAIADNPVHNVTKHYIDRKSYEEELRILYVALTRARERLYIVGRSPSADREKFLDGCRLIRRGLSGYSIRTLSSYLEIILATEEGARVTDIDGFVKAPRESLLERAEGEIVPEERAPTESRQFPISEELVGIFASRFSYRYPHEELTKLPEKLAVSVVSPAVLDGTDAGSFVPEEMKAAEDFATKDDNKKRRLPKFYSGEDGEESAKRGIATHLFMQFCNLESLVKDGAEAELMRLFERGFISEKDRARVRLPELRLFERSALLKEMLGARELYRELRFNISMPAEAFTEDKERRLALSGEELLVQGVIDCIVVGRDGEISVYDYKTDRLTREELADRSLAEAKLRARHKTQLSYYSAAVEKMFGRAPHRVAVYSLPLGDTVDM